MKNPRQSLNKAFLKVKPVRKNIEKFKVESLRLMDLINEAETEEFHKNLISHFFKDTYYGLNYFINTKGRNDLVIHNGPTAESTVGVILEVKKPSNKTEMIKPDRLNVKALQELLLYYLRERVTNKNIELKHLIVTNIHEWFIFEANTFEKIFYHNKNLIRQFLEFESGRLSGKTTNFFYKEIAAPAIDKAIEEDITFTYFDWRNYSKILKREEDTSQLISLYKLLSPEHLLMLPLINDSNSLNRNFYSELLHIIGLTEKKEGNKKIISRLEKENRNKGSLLERTITELEDLDKIGRLHKPYRFGNDFEERIFNVSLELVLTWINRILFLKLLEGQLISYHKDDKGYSFLNSNKIKSFDDLNDLFFQVLAKKQGERRIDIKDSYSYVPYLNSSLFEPTELEQNCFFVSQLREVEIPIYTSTVLRDFAGKKQKGSLNILEYLFKFLNAYDFSSEGEEKIQEESKTLINAAVLGLIFEKINGYQDGSFFTPGRITMYMSRQTIRRAVIRKFNEIKGWDCKDINQLYNKIQDFEEANKIINSIKICDPAVGSGHFLVSALNEILAIKSELKILLDRNGRTLRDYHVDVDVVNDELIVTDLDGMLFKYNPKNRESQRIQEALFHEKKIIIENCLFGVDINQNSVNICRLRLWIELLKNAYYKSDDELETLPNIDINIKSGNSLVSRYPLNAPISKITKKTKSKYTIADYINTISSYRNATNKDEKRKMGEMIELIKNNFETQLSSNDIRKRNLRKLERELFLLENQLELFERTKKEQAFHKRKIKEVSKELKKISEEISEIETNKIYEESFEWRFEFPEVLDENGNFVGFDIVIGNPPYIYRNMDNSKALKDFYKANYYNDKGNYDLYKYFIERAIHLLAPNGYNCFITNSSFLLPDSFEKTRKYILDNSSIKLINLLGPNVFDEATVDTAIYLVTKEKIDNNTLEVADPKTPKSLSEETVYVISQSRFENNNKFVFDCLLSDPEFNVVDKLFKTFPSIEKGFEFGVGINTGYIKKELVSDYKVDKRYHPMVPGKGISKRYGKIKTEGFIMYDKDYVNSRGKLGRALPDERFLKQDKILIVRTRNLSLSKRIVATLDTDSNYNLNRLSNIIAREGFNLYGLLGILNSKLFNWLYSKRYLDYEIKPTYLRNSPLADTTDSILINYVQEMLLFSRESHQDTKKIEDLEKLIDQRVFYLYGLSEDEIKIIEANTIS
ncbi:restriction endonuclease [Bacillus sp. OG2]|nr:restriction endonuclease [Bacillus sp. OG2]